MYLHGASICESRHCDRINNPLCTVLTQCRLNFNLLTSQLVLLYALPSYPLYVYCYMVYVSSILTVSPSLVPRLPTHTQTLYTIILLCVWQGGLGCIYETAVTCMSHFRLALVSSHVLLLKMCCLTLSKLTWYW